MNLPFAHLPLSTTGKSGEHWLGLFLFCFVFGMRNIYSYSFRPGADCGSDHELLIVKFRLKMRKLGKTTRPFRYGLNQIPYDYTVDVTNRFKGLDLIDRVPEEV